MGREDEIIERTIIDGITKEYSEVTSYRLIPSNFPYCSVLHYYYNKEAITKSSFLSEYYCQVGKIGHFIIQNVIANSDLKIVGTWECCNCHYTDNKILTHPELCIKCGGKEFVYKEINVSYNNFDFRIYGRVDGLLYDNKDDKFTLLEFKFITQLPVKVLESHKNQILSYCIMLMKYDIEIKSVYVIYLDISNPTKIQIFKINNSDNNLIVMQKRLDTWITQYKMIKSDKVSEDYVFLNNYRNLCNNTNFCVESQCQFCKICDQKRG